MPRSLHMRSRGMLLRAIIPAKFRHHPRDNRIRVAFFHHRREVVCRDPVHTGIGPGAGGCGGWGWGG